jgi:hypothetical protein
MVKEDIVSKEGKVKEVIVSEVWGGEGIYRSKGRDREGRYSK